MGLKSTSEAFRSFLLGETAFTAVMNEELYPYMAAEGKQFPLATYRIQQSEFATKDADRFDIVLFLWFQNYDDCAELTDALTEVFKASDVYDWKLSDLDYDAELKLFNGIINITTIT